MTNHIDIVRKRIVNPDFDHAEMNDAFASLAEIEKMIVPIGWKTVPVRPTKVMAQAAFNTYTDNFWDEYEAAVNAAPEPPRAAVEAAIKKIEEV